MLGMFSLLVGQVRDVLEVDLEADIATEFVQELFCLKIGLFGLITILLYSLEGVSSFQEEPHGITVAHFGRFLAPALALPRLECIGVCLAS